MIVKDMAVTTGDKAEATIASLLFNFALIIITFSAVFTINHIFY